MKIKIELSKMEKNSLKKLFKKYHDISIDMIGLTEKEVKDMKKYCHKAIDENCDEFFRDKKYKTKHITFEQSENGFELDTTSKFTVAVFDLVSSLAELFGDFIKVGITKVKQFNDIFGITRMFEHAFNDIDNDDDDDVIE